MNIVFLAKLKVGRSSFFGGDQDGQYAEWDYAKDHLLVIRG